VHYLLSKHVVAAAEVCPSLKTKRVNPDVLRHPTAMDLLQQGLEQRVLALWLGHESVEITQILLGREPRTEAEDPRSDDASECEAREVSP
jgi:hypothetical protein